MLPSDFLAKLSAALVFVTGALLVLLSLVEGVDRSAPGTHLSVAALYGLGFLSLATASLAFTDDRMRTSFADGTDTPLMGLVHGLLWLVAGLFVFVIVTILIGMVRFSSVPDSPVGVVRMVRGAVAFVPQAFAALAATYIAPALFVLAAALLGVTVRWMNAGAFGSCLRAVRFVAVPGAVATALWSHGGMLMSLFGLGLIGMAVFYIAAFARLQAAGHGDFRII